MGVLASEMAADCFDQPALAKLLTVASLASVMPSV
jgi:hypothetical protein